MVDSANKVCILVFNPFQNDTRILKEARTLTDAGYQVNIVAYKDSSSHLSNEVVNGFKVMRVSLVWTKFYRGVLRLIGLAEGPKIRSAHLSIKLLLLFSVAGTFYSLARYLSYLNYYWVVFRALREAPSDIYHASDANTLPLGWLLARRHKAKLVYDSHELWLDRNRIPARSRPNRWIIGKVEGFLARRSDAVITVVDAIGEVLEKRYGLKQPVTTLRNCPPYSCPTGQDKRLREDLGLTDDDTIMLYIGRVSIGRGIDNLVESLTFLSCHLVLLGDRQPLLTARIKRQVRREGLKGRVHMLDPVPYEDLINYASSADVNVVSFEDVGLSYFLSCPNKLFEGILAGLPTVGSNLPEIRRVIEDTGIGEVFNPDNPESLAITVRRTLRNRVVHRQKALEAAKLYNWEIEEKKLLEVYKKL